MTKIGQLKTRKSIELAMKEIKEWLSKINVNGLQVDIRSDAKTNVALLRFNFKSKDYEFTSRRQGTCTLNMWAIARVIEFKVRAQLMGIEEFGSSMMAYERIEGKVEPTSDVSNYVILGVLPSASNPDIQKKYEQLMKSYHPDMALSTEAKEEFGRKAAQINQAYTTIKKERGIT